VDALDLDVHLQRGHAIGGTGYLEVHVAEVIFVTQDIGDHREATVVFLHQAHGNTGHRRLHRHAGIHQRHRGAAYGRHRGGTVGFGDFRYNADRVREFLLVRQHCLDAATGETAVANFATLRRTDHAGFTDTERREVVVQHEAIGTAAFQRIDVLRITHATQGGNNDGLGFATGEQSGTVGLRQHADNGINGTHLVQGTTINTTTFQHGITHHAVLDVVEQLANVILARRT